MRADAAMRAAAPTSFTERFTVVPLSRWWDFGLFGKDVFVVVDDEPAAVPPLPPGGVANALRRRGRIGEAHDERVAHECDIPPHVDDGIGHVDARHGRDAAGGSGVAQRVEPRD